MQPDGVFYIVLTVCVVLFLGLFSWVCYELISTLRIIKRVITSIEDSVENFAIVKEGFKVGILTFLSKFLGDDKQKGGD